MDYFEKLNDPLKYYFKEKIGNLYINKTVINLFIHKGKEGEGKTPQEITDSFLRFSEIKELQETPKNDSTKRFIDKLSFRKKSKRMKVRNSIDIYADKKKKKQIEAVMQHKVNNHSERNTEINKIGSKFNKFQKNDHMIKETLDVQISSINSKLFARRQKSMVKSWLIRFSKEFSIECIQKQQ